MRIDDALGDEEAEPGSLLLVRLCPEPLEDTREIFRGDSRPGVEDSKADHGSLALDGKRHAAPWWCELERIADQVREHLQHALAVREQREIRLLGNLLEAHLL